MPRRGRVHRRLIVALLVGMLMASCTAGPSSRPAVVENDAGPPPSERTESPPPVPLPGLAEPTRPRVNWSPCDEEILDGIELTPDDPDVSCGRLAAALDAPGLPGMGLARLGLTKIGDGPVPLVVLNDVGGEPGMRYAVRLAKTLPPELLETFTLIGLDRRGTGTSEPVNCVPPEERSKLLGHDPTTTVEPIVDAARTAGQQCAIALEDVQTAFDSWRTAGDLQSLREQLGVARLNILGHGDGSAPAAYFAARFPSQTGRVVLDGVPDPSPDHTRVLDGVATGAEAALDEFAADCVRRDCPLGDDPRAVVAELADDARATPLRVSGGQRMGSVLVLRAVLAGLAEPERWPELVKAVDTADGGNGTALFRFVEPWLTGTAPWVPRVDGALLTSCNDTSTRLPTDQLRQVSRDLGAKHPVFGAVMAQQLAWCGPWPSRQDAAPEFGSPSAPPILVLSTAVDPVTPEAGTVRAVEQIPSAVRVAWQGAGHGALGSPCVDEEVTGFLVHGEIPRDGTLCPA